MKKFALFVVLIAVLLSAYPVMAKGFGQDAQPITVEDFPVLQALMLAFFSWLVTEGLKSLSSLTGAKLEGQATAITGAVVFIAGIIANGLLALIPAEYNEIARNIILVIIGVFSMYGFAGLSKRFQPK